MLGQKSKKKGPKCHGWGQFGHIRHFCKDLENSSQRKGSKPVQHKANAAKDNTESDSESLGLVSQALTADVRDNNAWIIDSGATCYTCNNRNLLDDFFKLNYSMETQLRNGEVFNATRRGTVTQFTVLPGGEHKKRKLQNVLLVPKLSYNLLGVSKAIEAGYLVSFEDNAFNITRADGVTIATGSKVR